MTQKVKVTVDVHCKEKADERTGYKLYVEDSLVAERDFVWDHTNKYVQEQMTLTLDPGKYQVKIQPIGGLFEANNLIIDNQPQTGLVIDVINNT